MKYVFGPVPSRRLGQSLGIDTIPLKTCNWNCVYCQLGRTVPVTNERREYLPSQPILQEAQQALASLPDDRLDWVTFVGSGEPTLHARIGWLIRQIKACTEKPVAVITNGSLLHLPEVREELRAADAILPTLDAGRASLYRKINRPHAAATFERLVTGLVAFRKEFSGQLWVEVMLVRGLNDGLRALEEIAAVLDRIRPDEVHISLPTRPPAETWVQPPDQEGLLRAISLFGNVARVLHPADGEFDLGTSDQIVDAVVGIITRHPVRQEDLELILHRWTPGQIENVLADLQSSGRAQVVERYGTRFWAAAPSRFPSTASSMRSRPGHGQRGGTPEKRGT